jgi:NAD(P)H-flavin reductase
MTTILAKETLAPRIVRMRIAAPRIAKKRRAGQFIILRPTNDDERIPLTIAHASAEEGWIEIIFQVVGQGTTALAALEVGQSLTDLVGPLGRPTHIEKFGRVLCIGGGVGTAPLHPIARALSEAGNHTTTIIGARSKELILLKEEMESFSDRVLIATDDGTAGKKGFVLDVVRELLAAGEHFDLAVVIGPALMMRFTSQVTLEAKIPTVVSLNPIMVDGTGMCGGCRVSVHGKTQFACVDGPEFDAAGVDWTELSRRLTSYRTFEKQRMQEHTCQLAEVK